MAGGWGTPSWMGGDPDVGETFVWGRDRETARDLLETAEALGFDPLVVRATSGGFVVPNDVWDAVQEKRAAAGGEF